MSSAKVPKPFGESVNTKAFPRPPLCFLSRLLIGHRMVQIHVAK